MWLDTSFDHEFDSLFVVVVPLVMYFQLIGIAVGI